jgi:hypothetical protein
VTRPAPAAAAAVLLAALGGAAASAVLLPTEVQVTAGGDWKAVSEGLRWWSDKRTVVSGPRFVVHAHDLSARAEALRLLVHANPGAAPMRLHAWRDGAELWARPLTQTPEWLSFPLAPGAGGVDVLFDVDSDAPPARARVVVDTIAVRTRPGLAVWLARIVPAVLAALTAAVLWSRGRRWTALGWALWIAAVSAATLAAVLEPAALLRFDPPAREAARIAAVAALWALALAEPPSRPLAAATVVATAFLVYAPTLTIGLLSDDFLWARPWTAAELLGSFAGSEDPLARTTGTYRPIANLTRALDHALWGVRAAGHHLTNLVLLAVAGLVAWTLAGRLRAGPRAALAAAVVWVAHPLSVASAAWVSQRTDSLAAIFYLGSLAVFLAPGAMTRGRAIAVVALATLALASKEMAVTLPLAAFLVDRVARPETDRPRRTAVLRILVLLVVAYVALWAGLFPEKMLRGETQRGAWLGFDPRRPGDWLRLLPLLYATVFLPSGYERWFETGLREWPIGHLAAGLAVVMLVVAGVRRVWPDLPGPVAALGLAWPLAVVIPLLGARPDLYRLGLFPALAFGLVLAAAAIAFERRAAWLPPMAMGLTAVLLLPITFETVRAWGPDGFFAARAIEWSRRHPDWQAELTPEARALFLRQLELQDHGRRLLEGAP